MEIAELVLMQGDAEAINVAGHCREDAVVDIEPAFIGADRGCARAYF